MGLNTYPYSPFPASTEQLHKGDNEQIQAEIDQLKSDLTDLSEEVTGDATTYPYADVITIEDAVPSNLAGCVVKIEPVQSGSGDPSPTNIRPITGHTEASVVVTDGDETTKTYTIALGDTFYGGTVDFNTGVMTVDRAMATENDFTTVNGTSAGGLYYATYSVSVANTNGICNMLEQTGDPWSSTTPCLQISQANGRMRVYGNFTTLQEFQTAFAGLQICYYISTPTTIQLTPKQIQLLKGTNTLTASTGQISVTVNGVSGAIGSVQEQVNGLAEEVAEIDGRLYALDTYVLNTPVKIGKWFDSVLYRKVISFGALPNATFGSVSSGLSNVAIVNIRAFARSETATIMLNYPDCKCYYNHSNDTVVIAASADFSSYTSCYVVLEYYEQPNS